MTLWSTGDEAGPGSGMMGFSQSLDLDRRLLPYDVDASIAWAEALVNAGALSHEDFEAIRDALRDIEAKLDAGELQLDPSLEDVHMNLESLLIERLGDTGARLHYGRSRNDQVLVDVKLYCLDVIADLKDQLGALLRALLERAREHRETFLPGYTHLQPAQPVRLGHYLMAYFFKFKRDFERLEQARERVDSLPLGNGALAGSGVEVDREFLARELGFSTMTENSMDGVSERDFMVDLLHAFAQMGVHASRLCEDWVLWSSPPFGFCRLDEAYTTGSSIMPQKVNPDAAELIRGHTGRLAGSLQGLLTVLKGQPMTYNRDLQEDKYHLFVAVDSVRGWLPVLTGVVESVEFDEAAMDSALEDGFLEATDLADYLVEKGVPFREAHDLVRQVVQRAMEEETSLRELSLDVYHEVDHRFDPGLFKLMDADQSTRRRELPGGTGPSALKQQFDRARAWLVDHDLQASGTDEGTPNTSRTEESP